MFLQSQEVAFSMLSELQSPAKGQPMFDIVPVFNENTAINRYCRNGFSNLPALYCQRIITLLFGTE